VHVYKDGTVLLNHGGTEMGQGLFTKVRQVVAHELGIRVDAVRVSASDTSKVPNASPTGGVVGQRHQRHGRARGGAHAARPAGRARRARVRLARPAAVTFRDGAVSGGTKTSSFADLVDGAYHARVPLSATGFYATPKIHYDRHTLSGRPFFYYAYGAACAEVAIDTLTGEHRLLAVDILHDVGRSLNPAIDRGQIEGGFLQGWGWLAMEELWWNDKGELKTHAPSTYKIPTSRDWPTRVSVDFGPTRTARRRSTAARRSASRR
jgi:xanthine dehydrogenase large subunit